MTGWATVTQNSPFLTHGGMAMQAWVAW